jgi:hypothetical protein
VKTNARLLSHLALTALVSLAIASTTAKAGDFFVTREGIFVFQTEQDCSRYMATGQIATPGRVAQIPTDSELIVENVGSNGIDKVKLKGYPIDLFTPNLLGFRASK